MFVNLAVFIVNLPLKSSVVVVSEDDDHLEVFVGEQLPDDVP